MLEKKLEDQNKKVFAKTFANLELKVVHFKLVVQML
jgi:hypothetical protein